MRALISGAGVAGPTLAHWLLRSGHEVTIVEKAPAFRAGGYIVDFWGVGYAVAERMGILPAVHEAGYRVREVRLVDARGRKRGGFDVGVFQRMTDGRFVSLPRGDLALAIYNTVKDRVATIFGDEIESIEQDAGEARVRFHSGGAARSFDLVIGADGLHSRVRELVFGPESAFEKRLGYHVAAFAVDGYRPRDELVYIAHGEAGRQVARFSLRGDRTMFLLIFASERAEGAEPRGAEGQRALLRRVFADVGWECLAILRAMDDAAEVYFDRVSQIRMDAWSKGRVTLLGDAAACVSLLAGEGSGLAMAEAYTLAGELARAGDDYAAAFRRHEERLRRFIEGKQRAAVGFAKSFAPRTALGVWARDRVTLLMGIPWVGEFFMGRSVRDDLELGG